MSLHRILVTGLSVWLMTSALPALAMSKPQSSGPDDRVRFPSQCATAASTALEKGVYQMHHMMYDMARGHFERAAEADPSCALAYWGQAMTLIHPLWPDRPTLEIIVKGRALSQQAVEIGGHDERETLYLATALAYFQNAEQMSEAERLTSFESAWATLHEDHPMDQEAKAFYALSQIATADPSDKTYAQRIAAGSRAEEVLKELPTHPGAQHYIIHAFDVPGLAERAFPVARRYGVIAPEVPHALHMMSHIFTRQGLWDESAEWNERSAVAALKVSQDQGAISLHYLHALDYLVYAYLQKGQDQKARQVNDTMATLTAPFGTTLRIAMAYAFAASPARIVLEKRDWESAATLQPMMPQAFPWEPTHAPYVALTHFARGLGLAHLGEMEKAKGEVDRLNDLIAQTEPKSRFWATQIKIQRQSVEAWILFLSGDQQAGLAKMKDAADLEAITEKSPVTPGELVPASELLGDMFMVLEDYDQATTAYRTVLVRSPNRLNSLFGAAQALEKSGDEVAAKAYYGKIISMTDMASERPVIVYAREFISD